MMYENGQRGDLPKGWCFSTLDTVAEVLDSYRKPVNSDEREKRIYGKEVTGTTRLKLNQASMRRIPIKIPPVNEQPRIVDKIEELFSDLDAGIESLKKAQQQLKIYRQAVLKWAFEGKLTEGWRQQAKQQGIPLKTGAELLADIKIEREKRYQQQVAEWEGAIDQWEKKGRSGNKPGKPQEPKDFSPLTDKEISDIPFLPTGWIWIQLGEILYDIEAGKSFKCEEIPPKNDEIGVAKVSAVTWGEYNELESKTCIEKERINESFLIKSGDFLFSRANTIELVGACVIVKKTSLNVMLSDKTLRFSFLDKFIKSSFSFS
jgi:type I restriction enzyme, S subunit